MSNLPNEIQMTRAKINVVSAIILLLCLCVLLLSACIAHPTLQVVAPDELRADLSPTELPGKGDPEMGRAMTALGRLQTDYEVKRLTVDDYILYKYWALFAPERLLGTPYALSPEEAGALSRCSTMLILEIRELWPRLSSETREQLAFVLFRPTDPGGGVDNDTHLLPQLYTTTNFVIHWTTGADGGQAADAPDLTDTSPANGIPDYIENLGAIFEDVRTFEVTTRGFFAPQRCRPAGQRCQQQKPGWQV